MRYAFALVALLACASVVRADELRVVSPRADSVSVTIYRDLFALITETRTVDLPAGPVTLVLDGVIDSLLPQSAVLADSGRAIVAADHDQERLDPGTLLLKSIGKSVMLTRTDRGSGRVWRTEATLTAAGPQGAVFRTVDGTEALQCSGLAEGLTFDEIPEGLGDTPKLSIRLAAGTPGKRQVRVSYLAHGFGWKADYVATLAQSRARMDLRGWITLHNLTATGLENAEVQVVAGRLNLLDAEYDRGTGIYGNPTDYEYDDQLARERDARLASMLQAHDESEVVRGEIARLGKCYPMGEEPIVAQDIGSFPVHRAASDDDAEFHDLEEVIVTGIRGTPLAVRERLADYQLYRLPERTSLAARQTKQVAFLDRPAVAIERFYSLRIGDIASGGADDSDMEDFDIGDAVLPARIRIGWRNVESDGLGEPLPGGIVRFFEAGDQGAVFVGDARMLDSAVGSPVELGIGRALDITLALADLGEPDVNPLALITRRFYLPVRWVVRNGGPAPVVFELRQGAIYFFETQRVRRASISPGRKSGDYTWRLTVPAHGETTLSYELGGKVDPDML